MTDHQGAAREDVWRREAAAHDDEALERKGVAVYYESLSLKRATRDYEQTILAMPQGARLLEIGCGEGQSLVKYTSAGLEAVGVDISARLIARAKENLVAAGLDAGAALQMNVELLDFPENSFDMICGRSILHHLTDLSGVGRRIGRALRPGGSCVFLEPLGHNPGLAMYRRLTPGTRTADEHPLRRKDLGAFLSHFGRSRIRSYLLCGLLASAAYFATSNRKLFRLLDRLAYPLDRLVLGLPGPHRYLAFACVMQAWKGR